MDKNKAPAEWNKTVTLRRENEFKPLNLEVKMTERRLEFIVSSNKVTSPSILVLEEVPSLKEVLSFIVSNTSPSVTMDLKCSKFSINSLEYRPEPNSNLEQFSKSGDSASKIGKLNLKGAAVEAIAFLVGELEGMKEKYQNDEGVLNRKINTVPMYMEEPLMDSPRMRGFATSNEISEYVNRIDMALELLQYTLKIVRSETNEEKQGTSWFGRLFLRQGPKQAQVGEVDNE
jgi:hypothetical protein